MVAINSFKNTISLITIFSVLITIFGVFSNFSSIPYWDMWDGYLNFYLKIQNGQYYEWFALHNEHRIFLSRILFFIDIKIFNNQSYFLVLCNLLFLSFAVLIFITFLRNNFSFKDYSTVYLVIVCLLFSWIQENNLIIGFQTAFVLAQLIPLVAFYYFFKSINHLDQRTNFFIISIFFGFLSSYTLISGIFVLPILTFYCFIVGFKKEYLISLIIVTAISLILYFFSYQSVEHHGSIQDAILHNPLDFINYVFLYFGGPFYYFFGKGETGMNLAWIAGFIFIFLSLYYFFYYLKKQSFINYYGWLYCFILYVGLTAAATAGGRLIFGASQALSSRYMTPVIFSWVCLIIITVYYLYKENNINEKYKKFLQIFFSIFLYLLVIVIVFFQLRVFSYDNDINFEKNIAALSIKMDVKDIAQIQSVYPNFDMPLNVKNKMNDIGKDIFNFDPFKDISFDSKYHRQKNFNKKFSNKCIGEIDNISFAGDNLMKISGWIYSPDEKAISKKLYVLNSDNKLIGFILTGKKMSLIKEMYGKNALNSGFKGYILNKNDTINSSKIKFVSYEQDCELSIDNGLDNIPMFRIKEFEDVDENSIVRPEAILSTEWLGQDYYSVWSGTATLPLKYNIYGSFSVSDAESGSITLRLNKGQGFFFRSEPNSKIQYMQINGGEKFFIPRDIPPASEWLFLEFNNPSLPDTFNVEITDEGAGWGEWSAVGLIR